MVDGKWSFIKEPSCKVDRDSMPRNELSQENYAVIHATLRVAVGAGELISNPGCLHLQGSELNLLNRKDWFRSLRQTRLNSFCRAMSGRT